MNSIINNTIHYKEVSVVYKVHDYVQKYICFTDSHAEIVFSKIEYDLKDKKDIILSFKDIHGVTSNFATHLLQKIMLYFSISEIKSKIKVTDCTPIVNRMIKRCYEALL